MSAVATAALIAAANDLEEEVRGARVVGEIGELADDEEPAGGVVVEPPAKAARRSSITASEPPDFLVKHMSIER